MEAIITKTRSLSDLETPRAVIDLEPYSIESNTDVSTKKEKQEDLKSITDFSARENSYFKELFKMKGFIGNEHWEKTLNISSRIASFNNDYGICACLIDNEKKIFRQRSFPRYLFNHIENIKSKPYVLLSIQSKTGSTRIDVIKGNNLVNKKAFELKDE